MSILPLRMTDAQREQELAQLMADYKTQLMRIAYMYLGDEALAEDAVQDTFIKAYNHMDRFRGESSKKTWLTRIAVNTCRDFQRGGWFKHTDRRITPDMLPVGAIQPDTEDLDLSLAVMKLPRKMREAIILYYYQDMSTEEIAETLGIAQSSVSNRLRRGREKLRKMLEGRDQNA